MNATLHDNSVKDVVRFLRQKSAFPDATSSVQLVETHISWVFLTDRYAYKLKKPVKFEFLDFSTLPLRKHACEAEVRLNRRLAEDVYRGVLPVTRDDAGTICIGGNGETLDWVVQMHRLPARKAIDVLIRKGELTSRDATMIAERLVRFYRVLRPETLVPTDYRCAIEQHIRANGDTLFRASPWLRTQIRRLQSAQLQYLHLESDLLDRRVEDGRIVDGHGDLRPEHIYLTEPIAVIDCVEFSRELRTVDVADELSFLAMECARLGNDRLGKEAIAAYERTSGDRVPPSLLAFYRTYRACVRAKVSLLRSRQEPNEKRRQSMRLVRQYMRWAEHYAAEIGRPILVVVGGLMGSGKSTLARGLSEALECEFLSTDHIRHSMFGPSEVPSDYDAGLYRPEARDRVYGELLDQADYALCKGLSVILDGTFLSRKCRQQANEIAAKHSLRPAFIVCHCPQEVALRRIQLRAQSGSSESEARADLYERQAAEYEEPGPNEDTASVDTTQPLSLQLQDVFRHLKSMRHK